MKYRIKNTIVNVEIKPNEIDSKKPLFVITFDDQHQTVLPQDSLLKYYTSLTDMNNVDKVKMICGEIKDMEVMVDEDNAENLLLDTIYKAQQIIELLQ